MVPAFKNRVIAEMRPTFQAHRERADRRVRGARAGRVRRTSSPSRTPPGSSACCSGCRRTTGRRWRAGPTTSGRRSRSTSATRCRKIEAALAGLAGYVEEVVADRRAHPRDDLVTTLVQAERGSATASCRWRWSSSRSPGWRPPATSSGSRCRPCSPTPTSGRLLGERPELGGNAVEEVMRVNPTVTWVTREALEDVEFQGLHIPKGGIVQMLSHAAGTDPRAVPDPSFDITEQRPPHHGFGAGIHHCLGPLRGPHRHGGGAAAAGPADAGRGAATGRACGCRCRATPARCRSRSGSGPARPQGRRRGRWLASRRGRRRGLVDVLEQVAGLALEHPAHRLEGAEPDRLGAAVLEHRDVGRRQTDQLGELPHPHLAPGQLDVDADDDRHQMTCGQLGAQPGGLAQQLAEHHDHQPEGAREQQDHEQQQRRAGVVGAPHRPQRRRPRPAPTPPRAAATITSTQRSARSVKIDVVADHRQQPPGADQRPPGSRGSRRATNAVSGHRRSRLRRGARWATWANCPGKENGLQDHEQREQQRQRRAQRRGRVVGRASCIEIGEDLSKINRSPSLHDIFTGQSGRVRRSCGARSTSASPRRARRTPSPGGWSRGSARWRAAPPRSRSSRRRRTRGTGAATTHW